jgi:hypothetical protein
MESSGPNGNSGTYLAGAVKSWATPNAFCYQPPENTEQWTKRAEYQQTEKGVNLHKPIQTQVLHEVEKMWRTPSVAEEKNQNTSTQIYLQNQVGATPKAWATPNTMDCLPPKSPEALARNLQKGGCRNLREDVVYRTGQWGTPTARDHKSGRGNEEREYKELTPMVERTQAGKLNPRWVETLMGLPVGWVMPSCQYPITPQGDASQEFQLSTTGNWPTASTMDVITPTRDLTQMESKGHWGKQPRQRPDGIGFIAPNTGKLSEMVHYTSPVTIEPTNCDSSATESCQQQQSELFAF